MQQYNNNMNKILSVKEAIQIAEHVRKQGKSIVLAGGCFDILHIGHITFLEEAKEKGNILFVLLESDESISERKGDSRPINSQQTRAQVLAALEPVDYIVLLPPLCKNNDYDVIIGGINPNVIAITEGDPNRIHKERQAKIVSAHLVEVTKRISGKSTTRLAEVLSEEL